MRLFRPHPAQALLVVVAGLSLAACSEDEKTALQVDVVVENGVEQPTTVTFVVSRNDTQYTNQRADWSATIAGKLKVTLLLPAEAAGDDTLQVRAFRGESEVAAVSQPVTIVADKTTGPVLVELKRVVGADGGVDALASDGAGFDLPREFDAGGFDAGMGTDLRKDGAEREAADADVPPETADGAQSIEVALTDAIQMVADATDLGRLDAGPSDVPQTSDVLLVQDADAATDATAADSLSPPTWHVAENIDKDNLSASSSSVAVDPIAGHVYVIWEYGSEVRVKRWNRNTESWESTKLLDHRGYNYSPCIGVDSAGRVIAVWYIALQQDASLSGVWAAHSTDGVSWSPPQRISQGRVIERLALGVARNGTARIAYTKQDADSNVRAYSAYYDGVAWTESTTPLAPETDMSNRDPSIAIDATGNGIILFSHDDDQQRTSVAVATFSGRTVDPYILLDTNTTDNLTNRVVAMNLNGKGVVVWGDTTGLQIRSYTPSAGWGAPQTFGLDVQSFYGPSVAMASDGTVTLAWSEWKNNHRQLFSMAGKAGGSWGSPEALENDNQMGTAFDGDHVEATVAVDASGDILVAWVKKAADGSFAVYGRHKHAGLWEPATKLGQHAKLQTNGISLAVGDSGLGVASWNWREPDWSSDTDPLSYQLLVSLFR